jgi:hypothetical protein
VGQRSLAEGRLRAVAENTEPPTYLAAIRDSLQYPIVGRGKKGADKNNSRTYLPPIRNSMQKEREGVGNQQNPKRGKALLTQKQTKNQALPFIGGWIG